MYYTYIHYKADTLEPFYIGKGKGTRYMVSTSRNRYWHNVVNKHGFISEILCRFDHEEDAFAHEIFLIDTLKKMGYQLTNITVGGEGGSGYKLTPEQHTKKCETMKQLASTNKWKNAHANGIEARASNESWRKNKAEQCREVASTDYWKEQHTLAMQKLSQDPSWLASQKIGAQKRLANPKWVESTKINAVKRSQDPSWKEKNKIALAKLSEAKKIPVRCIESGAVFDCIEAAVNWLKANGHPKAQGGNISKCCKRTNKNPIYKYTWEYINASD